MSVFRSICSPQALAWLEAYFSRRMGAKLHISLTPNEDKFFIFDDDGLVFEVPRFNLEAFDREDSVSRFVCDMDGLPFESDLVCFVNSDDVDRSGMFYCNVEGHLLFNCDFVSFVYFNLTRLEETLTDEFDQHERFTAVQSHALRFGYLDRPMVDYWMEVCKRLYFSVRPEYKVKREKFEILLTHDVDRPFMYNFLRLLQLVKFIGARIIKRQFGELIDFLGVCLGRRKDPYDTFDFIMTRSEDLSIVSEFYFITERTSNYWDGNYKLKQKKIVNLIQRIIARGHKVGTHFSYHTFKNQQLMEKEYRSLSNMLDGLSGLKSKVSGARMHYLRWRSWETAHNLAAVGISYDTTLGYAEQAGFRCGSCVPYEPFDPVSLHEIPITIIPLTAMEGTIWDEDYMAIEDPALMYRAFVSLISCVHEVGGVCNLLWHNSSLTEAWQRELYVDVIEYAHALT